VNTLDLLRTDTEKLRKKAYAVMKEAVGEKIYYRGLLEFSNICARDCSYCGIRKSNKSITRFRLGKEEIMNAALWCAGEGYGSLVLQSGERSDRHFVRFVDDVVRAIKKESVSEELPRGLGITLSCGEQSRETYQTWFNAGAHRYLLRIETTDPVLFSKIHPASISLQRRKACLVDLKDIGYQVGTGVMIGLPGQSVEDLARDIDFFREYDVDMIGMGPYIPHRDTPMRDSKAGSIELSLKMVSAVRISMRNINIAATSALQAIDPMGRERALDFGANIIMPLVTPTRVRKHYRLYDGKPCANEQAADCSLCLSKRIKGTGREIGFNEWGDSKHWRY